MKIALVTCRFIYDDYYSLAASSIHENLALEYIASLLRKNGYHVDLFNQDLENISDEHLTSYLTNNNYELVGFYTNCSNTKETLSTAKRLPSNIHKCLGGYSATLFPQELIAKKGVDSIIMGEGEFPFLELAQALKEGKDYSNIFNLVTKKKQNPMRPLIDIDELSNPVRDELYKKYSVKEFEDELRWALVSSSRGCNNNCAFCFVNRFYRIAEGQNARYRDPIKVVNEIEELVKGDLKINAIWFVDEDFIGKEVVESRTSAEVHLSALTLETNARIETFLLESVFCPEYDPLRV